MYSLQSLLKNYSDSGIYELFNNLTSKSIIHFIKNMTLYHQL